MSEPMKDWERELLADVDARHPKWQRVEPGTVIPAGQPYRTERDGGTVVNAIEYLGPASPFTVPSDHRVFFIDSSWKPPLVLPTEPTWGIAIRADGSQWLSQWLNHGPRFVAMVGDLHDWSVESVLDFIPLTDEQVARIEQAR